MKGRTTPPNYHPILFQPDMVRAILYGNKTMTRRVMKPQPQLEGNFLNFPWGGYLEGKDRYYIRIADYKYSPYGMYGDVLWVRERFTMSKDGPVYCADHIGDKTEIGPGEGPFIENVKWKPSIHMPFAVCRIMLKMEGVYLERLQSITEDDAKSEGVDPGRLLGFGAIGEKTYREGFFCKWIDINGYDSFKDNPWVWVIRFQRIQP